jgi:predicted esterase
VAASIVLGAVGCAQPTGAVDDDDGARSSSAAAGPDAGAGGSVGVAGVGGGPSGGGSASGPSSSGAGAAPPSCDAEGVDPSCGSGGPLGPGQIGTTPLGAQIRMPSGYQPGFASPVIWLFNEQFSEWSAIADGDAVVLVDLVEYNDIQSISNKLNETMTLLEDQYMVDRARYYWAGWSAGGNIVVIGGSQSQSLLAGTMVFPGTGGNSAKPFMEQNQGHKIRLFYACGDQDSQYPWDAVQYEANFWTQYGYQTHFEKVPGASHYIDETTYGIRAAAWAWIEGFNLSN